MDIVVKPQGLTGGKGVKVMVSHLPDLEAAAAYTMELLRVRQLLDGKCVQKEKKQCGILKSKVGAEGSEPSSHAIIARGDRGKSFGW